VDSLGSDQATKGIVHTFQAEALRLEVVGSLQGCKEGIPPEDTRLEGNRHCGPRIHL